MDLHEDIQQQLENWYRDLWKNLSVRLHHVSNCDILFSGVQSPYLNGVVKASLEDTDIGSIVKDVDKIFRLEKLPYSWWVDAANKPKSLEKALVDEGLKLEHEFPGFSLELKDLRVVEKPANVETMRVKNVYDLQVWSQIIGDVFDFPDTKKYADLYIKNGLKGSFLHLVGRYNGMPVSTASALYEKNVMSIYNVATVPSARGLGIASYLIYELLKLGKERKEQSCALLSSSKSAHIFFKLGFKERLIYNFYVKNL